MDALKEKSNPDLTKKHKKYALKYVEDKKLEVLQRFHNNMEIIINSAPLETFQMVTHLGLVPTHLSKYACLGHNKGGHKFIRKMGRNELVKEIKFK